MTRRTATLLWAAMLVVPFAFLGVALTVAHDHAAPALAGPILALAALASAANVVLAWALPPRLGPARARDRDAVAFTRVLVSLALCEAAALAPVVALVVTNDRRLLALLAAGVAALAALYPSDRRWEALRPQGDAEAEAGAGAAARRREAP
jgi:hypothetical protein